MQAKFIYGLCLAGSIFLNSKASAQVVEDSLQYRQAKLNIWCETIRFVYEDNGADSLESSLNCQSWEVFRKSLEPNYLQAHSFFQAIEKPSIYQGYSTFDAKLQKLISEIEGKLKSSPSRSADPVRLQKVERLQKELLLLASAVPETTGKAMAESEAESSPESTVLTENRIDSDQEEANSLTPEKEEMDWNQISQWLLLLLLSAGFALLWVKNRKLEKELNTRMNRRKQEISAIARIKDGEPAPVRKEPAPLSRAEIQSLVRSEIEKLRQQQKLQRLQALNESKKAEKQREQDRMQEQAKNTPKVSEEPEALLPTGKNEEKADPGLYYDKLPFKGGFHQNQLSAHRHPDSIYSILISATKPDEAEFWVTEDQEVQKYAMQNGLSFFEEACEYNQVEENPTRVRNLEKGRLRKNGHLWQIEKKVKVIFE